MNTCKCGNTDDYNFSINNGLCNGCIGKKLEENRWILTDNPPDDIDYDKVVEAIEESAKIPVFVSMAEIFLDEGSEYTHWRPIVLPRDEKILCNKCGKELPPLELDEGKCETGYLCRKCFGLPEGEPHAHEKH